MSSLLWIEGMRNTSPFHQTVGGHPELSRREFLWRSGGGLGGIALASLLGGEGLLASTARARQSSVPSPLPHFQPRAKRVIQMFMAGAASHIDLFDFKPELVK